jgi:hypothetical protein
LEFFPLALRLEVKNQIQNTKASNGFISYRVQAEFEKTGKI